MCSLTHTVKEIGVSLCVHQADGVAGVIKSRQYTIPSEYVERIDGEYFISLNRKHVYARRILCMQSTAHQQTAHADDGIANLSKSDVIDQLIAIRNRAVKLAVVEGNSDKVDKLKRRWHKQRKFQEQICALDKTMCIAAPEIGGMPSVQLRILTAWKGPLWVQLSDGMLTRLTSAIKYQVESGGVKSKRAKRGVGDDADDDVDCATSDASHDLPDVASVVAADVPLMPERSPSAVRTLPPAPAASPAGLASSASAPKVGSKITDFFGKKP